MAKKDDKKKKTILKAPVPTYTHIDPALNANYKRPTTERKSNIVVTQADLTPVQTQPQARPMIQSKGALAALQPKVNTQQQQKQQTLDYLNSPLSMTSTISDQRDTMSKGMTPGLPVTPPTGFLMNKLTPNAPLSTPNVQPPPPQTKQEWIDQQEENRNKNAPTSGFGGFLHDVFNPIAKGIDYIEAYTPGLSSFERGAGGALGVELDNPAPRGNSILDKAAYGAGFLAGGATNPAALEQNLVTAPYKAANAIVNRVAPNAGKVATRAATGALAGAGTGGAYSLITGQSDVQDVARNAALGAGVGALGDVVIGAAGDALSKILRRNNVPESDVQEILALPLGREDAARARRTSTVQTPDVIIPDAPPLGLPQGREGLPTGQMGVPEGPITVPARSPIQAKGALSNIAEPQTSEVAAARQPIQSKGALRQPETNERGLYSNVEQTDLAPEVREGLGASPNRNYDPITNADTVNKANARVAADLNAAASYAKSGHADAEKVATGFRVLQELQQAGRYEEAVDLVDNLAKKLTEAGQTVQAASILNRLSPEGQLLRFQRKIAEINAGRPAGKQITLSPETAQKITDAAESAQAARISQERAGEVLQITTKLRNGETLSAAEQQTLSDFADDLKTFMEPEAKGTPRTAVPPPEMKNPRMADRIVSWLNAKADQATQRLNKRRNNLSANPFDTWADMGIVAASKMATKTLKFADFTAEMLDEFGEAARPYLQRLYNQGKKVIRRETNRIKSGEARSAEEALRKEIRSTEAGKVADTYINKNADRMSADDIKKVRDLAQKIAQLNGASRTESEIILQKILNNYESSSMWDKIQAIRYISMLLNSGTQAVNALSGPAMASLGSLADVFGTMIDGAISTVLRKPRTTTLYKTNPLRFMAQWLKGAKVGGKAGWQGVSPSGITGPNEIRGLTFKSPYNPLGWLERSLGAVAKGADYGTYSAVQQSELRRIAYLDAKANKIKGSQNIKQHVENFMAKPTDAALEQADKIAKNTTFQRSDTLGGKAANWLNSSPKAVRPVAGAVFPFVRTPVNIASTAVSMTPAGIIKGLFQLSSKSEASQREAIRTLSLGLTGTGLMTPLGYYLSKVGIITGANDSGNKDVDAIREQAGQGKYRFNTSALSRYMRAMLDGEGFEGAEKAAKYQEGDKQFDYNKLQPIAFPLAVGAGLQNNEGKGLEEQLKGAGSDAYGSLYGMSTLKGVQDVFQPSYGGTLGEKALGVPSRIVESFLKSFSPSALAQETRRQDPIQRKTGYNNGIIQDTKEYFQSRTPGQSTNLPPNKTTLGQDKLNSPGFVGQYANPYKSDVAPYTKAAAFISNLIDSTGDESLAPSAPEKKVTGKDRVTGDSVTRAIPTDRYIKLQEEVGNEIIRQIEAIDPSLSDVDKASKVHDIYEAVNKKYRNIVKQELGIRPAK